jgi:AcrR family transcriptional regulator
MPYRRTENVTRRLAARHAAIIAAAREAANEGGMAAVQIAPVAQRAGIAAGTVYRYFPGKPISLRRCLRKSPLAKLPRCAARPMSRPDRYRRYQPRS